METTPGCLERKDRSKNGVKTKTDFGLCQVVLTSFEHKPKNSKDQVIRNIHIIYIDC